MARIAWVSLGIKSAVGEGTKQRVQLGAGNRPFFLFAEAIYSKMTDTQTMHNLCTTHTYGDTEEFAVRPPCLGARDRV